MLHVDHRNATARGLAERLRAALPHHDHLDVDLVVGGDGFMLETLSQHPERPCLGLNAGRIGFLMNDTEQWDQVVDQLQRQAWTLYAFPTLQGRYDLDDGSSGTCRAINDVAMERSTGQTAHLRLSVDGREIVDRLVADGLIVSTALGSTAYAFSAGGPAAHPSLALLAVTAVSPHHPRLAPILLPDDRTIHIEVHDSHRRPVRLVADGQCIDGVVASTIQVTPDRVHLAWLDGHDHTARMVSKILRP